MSEKAYRLEVVNDKKTAGEFLKLPVRLYRNEANWIRPLDQDIEGVFNPAKNKYFRHGECIRWILRNKQGQIVGRVAAFVDRKTANKQNDQPTGGMGFFECIDEQEAAFILFDACKEWLQERGMEAMDGPVNFGDRNEWWGLLVKGFYEPNYAMPYNFSYYEELFEAYGFQLYFNQYTYYRTVADGELDELVLRKAERVARNTDYEFRHIEKKKIEKYTEDMRTVYNAAWARFPGVKEMSRPQSLMIMKKLKPILDERLMWFCYHQDEPVGIFIMIPEINQYFKHLNGQMNLLRKLQFLWLKKRQVCNKALGIVFGIAPNHQGKGLEGALVDAFARVALQDGFPFQELEMNWIGDFNPKMMRVAEQVGGRIRKTHRTYRLLFDATKPYKRMPIMR